jgi:RNA polymerase sigma-70 factor (ECF subfamily)
MVRDADDAADLTQEAVCKALGQWHRFDGRVLVTTWLHRILANCVRDWLRRNHVRSAVSLDALPGEPAAGEGRRDALELGEQDGLLREAIEGLPTAMRVAFVLAVLDGYSYRQVADLLEVPVGTIASRIHDARCLVQEAMQRRLPEEQH